MAAEPRKSIGEDTLSRLVVGKRMGSGSNGAVLAVELDGKPYALKVVSHFWTKDAGAMLDYERQILTMLPRHRGVIGLEAEFVCAIPDHIADHLPLDMQEQYRALVDAGDVPTTQFFLLDLHPCNLLKMSELLPVPVPYGLVHRLATDLLEATHFLETHNVVHLDCKSDNILIAGDGRAVLCDFGIARQTKRADLVLELDGPDDLLLNRLVLAPEVLTAHDSAVADATGSDAAEQAGADSSDDEADAAGTTSGRVQLPLAGQGVWAVGVCLMEAAVGWSHFPLYPNHGDGVTVLPQARGVTYAADAGTVTSVPPSFPPGFRRLLRRMLSGDPSLRPRPAECVALLGSEALSPFPNPPREVYSLPHEHLVVAARPIRTVSAETEATSSRASSSSSSSSSLAASGAVNLVFCNAFGERESVKVMPVEPLHVAAGRTSARFRRLPPKRGAVPPDQTTSFALDSGASAGAGGAVPLPDRVSDGRAIGLSVSGSAKPSVTGAGNGGRDRAKVMAGLRRADRIATGGDPHGLGDSAAAIAAISAASGTGTSLLSHQQVALGPAGTAGAGTGVGAGSGAGAGTGVAASDLAELINRRRSSSVGALPPKLPRSRNKSKRVSAAVPAAVASRAQGGGWQEQMSKLALPPDGTAGEELQTPVSPDRTPEQSEIGAKSGAEDDNLSVQAEDPSEHSGHGALDEHSAQVQRSRPLSMSGGHPHRPTRTIGFQAGSNRSLHSLGRASLVSLDFAPPAWRVMAPVRRATGDDSMSLSRFKVVFSPGSTSPEDITDVGDNPEGVGAADAPDASRAPGVSVGAAAREVDETLFAAQLRAETESQPKADAAPAMAVSSDSRSPESEAAVTNQAPAAAVAWAGAPTSAETGAQPASLRPRPPGVALLRIRASPPAVQERSFSGPTVISSSGTESAHGGHSGSHDSSAPEDDDGDGLGALGERMVVSGGARRYQHPAPASPMSSTDLSLALPGCRLLMGAAELTGGETAWQLSKQWKAWARQAKRAGAAEQASASAPTSAPASVTGSDRSSPSPELGEQVSAARPASSSGSGPSTCRSADQPAIEVWLLPELDEVINLSQEFALTVFHCSSDYARAVAPGTETSTGSAEPLASVLDDLASDSSAEAGDARVQLRAMQALQLVAARAYSLDEKDRCLDLPRISEAAAMFARAHTEQPHTLCMALSVLRNTSCVADEAGAQKMASNHALEWACYAIKVQPEDDKVAEEATHLCGNLIRFPSLQSPDSLSELAELCTTVLMYHSGHQMVMDGLQTLVERILAMRPADQDADAETAQIHGPLALVKADFLRACELALYEQRRAKSRLEVVLGFVAEVLASGRVRDLEGSWYAPEVAIQCLSLLDREALHWERDVVNGCLLCIRNACCLGERSELARVASACATYDGLQRIDAAMERFDEDPTLLDNGRCATYNVSIAGMTRAALLEEELDEIKAATRAKSGETPVELSSSECTPVDNDTDAATHAGRSEKLGEQADWRHAERPLSTPGNPRAEAAATDSLRSASSAASANAVGLSRVPLLPTSAPGSPGASALPTSPNAPLPSGYARLPSHAPGTGLVIPRGARALSPAAARSAMQLRIAVAGIMPGEPKTIRSSRKSSGVNVTVGASLSASGLVPLPPVRPPSPTARRASQRRGALDDAANAPAPADTAASLAQWQCAALSFGGLAAVAGIVAIIGWST